MSNGIEMVCEMASEDSHWYASSPPLPISMTVEWLKLSPCQLNSQAKATNEIETSVIESGRGHHRITLQWNSTYIHKSSSCPRWDLNPGTFWFPLYQKCCLWSLDQRGVSLHTHTPQCFNKHDLCLKLERSVGQKTSPPLFYNFFSWNQTNSIKL
jgi:hypothetical protein